jgi:hypothetical protein
MIQIIKSFIVISLLLIPVVIHSSDGCSNCIEAQGCQSNYNACVLECDTRLSPGPQRATCYKDCRKGFESCSENAKKNCKTFCENSR